MKKTIFGFITIFFCCFLFAGSSQADLSVLSNDQMGKMTGVEGICYTGGLETCLKTDEGQKTSLDGLSIIEDMLKSTESDLPESSNTSASNGAAIIKSLNPKPEPVYGNQTSQAILRAYQEVLKTLWQ